MYLRAGSKYRTNTLYKGLREIERQTPFTDSFCTRNTDMLRVVFVTLVVLAVYTAGLPLDKVSSISSDAQAQNVESISAFMLELPRRKSPKIQRVWK
ncbi:hypothetical protein ScPMuIL_003367 [Solemya velum]